MRTFPIVLLAVSMTLPSFAATPAMEACSAKWADLKAAGKDRRADMAAILEPMQQGFRRQ